MKTIGIIGGLSWFSTSVYYSTINEYTHQLLGESHSARILLYSIDFHDFKLLQEKDDWTAIENLLSDIAIKLENASADFIMMATNTPHLVADSIRKKIRIPFLHIAEETAKEIINHNISQVALLGTRFTMENDFFKERLSQFGIGTIIPETKDRDFIHQSIFEELTTGVFLKDTKDEYLKIIDKLKTEGAEAVIFGCTELALLIKAEESSLPVFDTSVIHAKAAVNFALSD
ncbi:aspartate/glutamate racemase family protein [Olivibacter sp. CPCC 100613]|uniref:aspartate/glutamate racemase family protein n=1 Tax=Olivibacter sp. CPCC 100613 TaxID=3079931 RepID=UPI002FFBA8F9